MDLFDRRLHVGIVGSRRRDSNVDYRLVLDAFLRLVQFVHVDVGLTSMRDVLIVSGGCPQGGDRFAEIIACEYRAGLLVHRPDRHSFPDVPDRWRATRQNYYRNELVARDSRDELIACVALDRTGGTEDTIRRFRRIHGKEPILV